MTFQQRLLLRAKSKGTASLLLLEPLTFPQLQGVSLSRHLLSILRHSGFKFEMPIRYSFVRKFLIVLLHRRRTLQGRLRYKGSSYLLRICLFQPSQSCSSTLSNLIQPHRLTSAFTMVSAVFTLPSSSSDAPHDFEHNPGNSTGSSCVIARDQPVNGEHNPGNSTGSSCVIAREQPVNEEHNPGNSTGSSCVIA